MLIEVTGAKCIGIDAVPVKVEVDISPGLGVHLVGMADVAVKESLLRTMTALQATGFKIPGKKIVINLAPADVHKKGGGYDLPIALGIIAASGQRDLPDIDKYLIMGELGLDGSIRSIPGALPMVELAAKLSKRACIFPAESAKETIGAVAVKVYAVRTLSEVLEVISGGEGASSLLLDADSCGTASLEHDSPLIDFADIVGQDAAKRGLEIAAAGGHNVMMIGPPGSGKSSLAKAMIALMPPMDADEALLTRKIYSVAGRGPSFSGLHPQRPFRAPHYSASMPSMVGGGNGDNIIPGEISLAEGGILFLDEFAQFPKTVTEALRGPLEDRKVTISRLRSKVEYPASFMLVAASNPCPCGYYGEGQRCTCSVGQRNAYLGKLSGPILDRIDIQLWLHSVDARALVGSAGRKAVSSTRQPTSAEIAVRVARAREIQRQRYRSERFFCNAEIDTTPKIHQYCSLSDDCKEAMTKIIEGLSLSARAYTRILKVARTIADLSAAERGESFLDAQRQPIEQSHLFEAASYRFLDRRDVLEL